MSGMLFLLFVQRQFQFGAKLAKWEGYYGEKNYLDMSFALSVLTWFFSSFFSFSKDFSLAVKFATKSNSISIFS